MRSFLLIAFIGATLAIKQNGESMVNASAYLEDQTPEYLNEVYKNYAGQNYDE